MARPAGACPAARAASVSTASAHASARGLPDLFTFCLELTGHPAQHWPVSSIHALKGDRTMHLPAAESIPVEAGADLVNVGMFPDFLPPIGAALVHRATGAKVIVQAHGRDRIMVAFEDTGGHGGFRPGDLMMSRDLAVSARAAAPVQRPASSVVAPAVPAARVLPAATAATMPPGVDLSAITRAQQLAAIAAIAEAKGGKDKNRRIAPSQLVKPVPEGRDYRRNRAENEATRTDATRQAHMLAQQMQIERTNSIRTLGRDLSPGEALARAQRALAAA